MANLIEEDFVNDIGQTLKPGDKVIAVISGYGHNIFVRPGIYRGTYRNTDGVTSIQVDVESKYTWMKHNGRLQLKRAYAIV